MSSTTNLTVGQASEEDEFNLISLFRALPIVDQEKQIEELSALLGGISIEKLSDESDNDYRIRSFSVLCSKLPPLSEFSLVFLNAFDCKLRQQIDRKQLELQRLKIAQLEANTLGGTEGGWGNIQGGYGGNVHGGTEGGWGNVQGGTMGGWGNTQGGNAQGGGWGNTQGGNTQGGGWGNTQGGNTQGGGWGNTQGGNTQGGGGGNWVKSFKPNYEESSEDDN